MLQLCAFETYGGELRAGVLAQRVSLIDIGGRGDTFLVTVARQLESAVVHLDGVLQKLDRRIVTAQREIVTGELGLQGQLDSCEVGGTCLGLRACGGRSVAQAAEKIYFPVQVESGT